MNRNYSSFKRGCKPIDPRLNNIVSFFANNQRFVYSNNSFSCQNSQSIQTSHRGSLNNQNGIIKKSIPQFSEKVSKSGKTKSVYEGPNKSNDLIVNFFIAICYIESSVLKLNFFKQKQNLFVVRHGERVDITFGHEWVSKAFDSNGINR